MSTAGIEISRHSDYRLTEEATFLPRKFVDRILWLEKSTQGSRCYSILFISSGLCWKATNWAVADNCYKATPSRIFRRQGIWKIT